MTARKILVTGATGFLGSYVMERFEREWNVEVIGLGSVDCDLTYASSPIDVFGRYQPDSVIHLAAVCGGIGANMKEPGRYLHANAAMAMNVIDAARVCRVKKVIMVGSVCQYPENTPAPFKEEDLWNGYPEPTNAPYGIAKRFGMEMMKAYHQQYGLQGSFLIPANLYGPRDNFNLETSHVIPALIRKTVEAKEANETVKVWGAGAATRDFLYAADAADAIVRAEALDGFHVMNLGTGVATSIFELALKIGGLVGHRGQLLFETLKPDGQMVRCIDSTRAKNILGWEAKTTLDEGLAETVKWYLDNRR